MKKRAIDKITMPVRRPRKYEPSDRLSLDVHVGGGGTFMAEPECDHRDIDFSLKEVHCRMAFLETL